MTMIQAQDYKVYAQTTLISSVANLYYTLLMLDRQKQIVDDMLGLTKNTWDVMKLQMEFGRARSTSVQSAEAAFYSVQTQAADIRRQIRETENTLSLLLGEPAQTVARGSLDNQSLPANFAGGIGVQLLSNRADVHANEMALAQCFYNVQTARSRFYPSLTISPTGAWTNSGGMVNPGKLLLSVVGSLTQPIFMRGQLKAGLRVAEDKYKQAYNTWQNSILKAGSEVSNALVAYNAADEKSGSRTGDKGSSHNDCPSFWVRSRSRCLRLHGNRGSHNPTRIRTETEYIFPLRNGLKSRFLPFVNTP